MDPIVITTQEVAKAQIPVQGASQFNYNIAINFGAQFFPRPGRSFSVGWKYDHLSNHYEAHLNPGLDSGVFYVGFSMFRGKEVERRRVSREKHLQNGK